MRASEDVSNGDLIAGAARTIIFSVIGAFWGFVVLIIILAICASCAFAHESWISKGGLRNAAGEWCCGEGDCFVVGAARTARGGYVINGTEFVPQSEAQPSPDGQFWRCKRPDGSRRCFFAPPPAM